LALIKCKECEREISSDAAACPNCGKPVVKTTPAAKGCLSVIAVIGLFVLIGHCSSNHEDSKPKGTPTPAEPAPPPAAPASTIAAPPAPPVTIDKATLIDAKALDEKFGTDAFIQCASEADDYLRGAAKYAFKWDEIGFLEQKFDKYLSHVSAPGVLTMISSKVSLQNGFGAYERIELYCDYDTQAKKTLGYSINSRPYHPTESSPSTEEGNPTPEPSPPNAAPTPIPTPTTSTVTEQPPVAAGRISTPVVSETAQPSRAPASTGDDLAAVRASDTKAADHIASSCRQAAGDDAQHEMLCRAHEMAAWRRLVPGREFPALTQPLIDKCKQPPFPDTFVALEACARYELSAVAGR